MSSEVAVERSRKLNLGCGTAIREGWVNVDAVPLEGVDVIHDLGRFPWPFGDDAFDQVHMIHVLEHLPDTVGTMEELWRICRNGARISIQVPYWNSFHVWRDPTHVKGFHQSTFDFFIPGTKLYADRGYYTKARFQLIRKDYYVNTGLGEWRQTLIRRRVLKRAAEILATFFSNIIVFIDIELRVAK